MKIRLFILTTLLLLPLRVVADVAVLIHGYLGDGSSWQRTGIIATLASQGWLFGGHLAPGYALPAAKNGKVGSNTVYVAELPSTAPLLHQADILAAELNNVRKRHGDEAITLVGHSAGGVVARLALVRHGAANINHLITIAAPHLGTPRAGDGLDITNNHGPFEPVKSLIGGELYDAAKHSRALYYDLTPPHPGNILYWLNLQRHPDILYTSVLRIPAPNGEGDDVVPSFSQDMNQVPSLQGKSAVLTTPAPHYLRRDDGISLLQLLTLHAT